MSRSMREESSGGGVTIKTIHVGEDGSLSPRILMALIDTSLSDGGLQRLGGGGGVIFRAFFPPALRHTPFSVG